MATIEMDVQSAWDTLDGVHLPGGYRVEITDGKIIMTPRGESQWKVINKDQIPFGEDLVLALEGREIVVTTDGFPRSDV